MINVSVILATFNKYPLSIEVVKYFEQQTFNHNNFEVIVVDDGSQDGTWKALQELKTSFSLRLFETGLTNINGMCIAKNKGIKNAKGNVVLFFDDDTFAHPDAILHHIEFYKKHSSKSAAIGFRTSGKKEYLESHFVPDQTRFIKRISKNGVVSWGSNVMNNTSFLRKEIIDIGMFDEEFNMYGKRDKELAFRYFKYGGALRLCMGAVSYHFSSDGTKWANDHGGVEGLKKFKLEQAKKMDLILRKKVGPKGLGTRVK